jgi:hypothetical protein
MYARKSRLLPVASWVVRLAFFGGRGHETLGTIMVASKRKCKIEMMFVVAAGL